MQKRHARGNILRPVIAAHGHFKLLSQRFPEVKTHVIAHECFLRGAAIVCLGAAFSSAARRSMVCGRRDKEPSQPGSVAATGENPSWLVAKFMAALDAGRESENGSAGLPALQKRTPSYQTFAASRRFTIWLEKQTRVCAERPVFRRARNANSGLTGSRV